MIRFLTTLVLTVVGLITASLWWSTQDGARPFTDLGLPPAGKAAQQALPEPAPEPSSAARPSPAPDTSAAPRAARKPPPTRTTPASQGADRMSAPRSEPKASEGRPLHRSVPPIPGPVFPERTRVVSPATDGPEKAVPPAPMELPGETVVPGRRPFAEQALPGGGADPEAGRRAVAMGRDPAQGASLIRRLLDVYEGLEP